ncbi:MAG: hypothetical protein IT364_24165 [Candidatus Hydrogenedentes bacterium]|nr:hypothetical protein [Candidatus Hydrogenedentota bacterium]
MNNALLFLPILAIALCGFASNAEELSFENPPEADRPWVYWFWKNGNISKEGITADLEAMERVGIGGAILMEVSLSVPPGKYSFFSEEWRGLFKHAVLEANRLGLSISMNSAPGWTGSGGPWVTPEQSMQKVVFSETAISGPNQARLQLPQPETVQGFYRDIAVVAFPSPAGAYRIDDISEKAFYRRGPFTSQPAVRATLPSLAEYHDAPTDSVIPLEGILDITSHMDASGMLSWSAPEGEWTILRIGHTSTGQTNRPAPLPGLECDKLDTEALDAHFREFISVLLEDVGPEARKALVAVHLDSWEVGAQNWTRRFREEFQARRGYDLLPYMPVMTGRVVQSLEVSERFLWDLRQTVSEMLVENHGRHLRGLAQEQGLWFSVEPYDMTPCDDMTLGATGDVPMCEFWSNVFDSWYSVREATSVAHVYGKPVVAAEAFTSIDRWLLHPGAIKAQGDWAFCEGINRFVIHRYIHQPYPNIRPGLSLGPHGLHYERTQTWWEYSRPWHEYLARCQHLLKQGRFVADILYLSPEGAPNVFQGPDPAPKGYKYDGCTPEALLARVSAEDGQLVLPGGMRYRMLVLPQAETMTPAVLARIRDIAAAGVAVVGMPPRKSPSLSNYPACDAEVQHLAKEIWSAGHEWTPVQLAEDAIQAHSGGGLRDAVAEAHWIWYPENDPASPPPPGKRYFRRTFTVPSDAAIQSARMVVTADNSFSLYVNGAPAGSGSNLNELFALDLATYLQPGVNLLAIAAENKGNKPNAAGVIGELVVTLDDGREITVVTNAEWQCAVEVDESWVRAAETLNWVTARDEGQFGVAPWEDVGRKAVRIDPYPDSREIERLLKDMGVPPDFASDAELDYVHRAMGATHTYFVCNESQNPVEAACAFRVTGMKAQLWHPESGRKRDLSRGSVSHDGRTVLTLRFEPEESYFVVFSPVDPSSPPAASGRSGNSGFPSLRTVLEISGPWNVTFTPQDGGPEEPVVFENLADWSQRSEDSIRYYSGTAAYAKTVDIPANVLEQGRPLYLDLGRVEVVASVSVNGKAVGTAWKRPFRVDVSGAAKPGSNALEIRVANLWPNRMIGDEHLPPDSDRNADGTLKQWPQWMIDNQPSPTGRRTLATWQHWTKDDPLLPSGLLGPVTLMEEE